MATELAAGRGEPREECGVRDEGSQAGVRASGSLGVSDEGSQAGV